MKFNPVLAGYLAVGIATIAVVWYIKDKFEFGAARIGKIADAAATDYGQQESAAETGPFGEWNHAREDYILSLGYHRGTDDYTIALDTKFPDIQSWENGEGPKGYLYGDAKYPKIEAPSVWTAFSNVF